MVDSERGARPVVRAVLGLALGFLAGAVAAALVPRERAEDAAGR